MLPCSLGLDSPLLSLQQTRSLRDFSLPMFVNLATEVDISITLIVLRYYNK